MLIGWSSWSVARPDKLEEPMKIAYWVLLALAVALGIFGYVKDMQWLIFVAVGIIVVAAILDPKRSLFGLRKKS